MTDVKSFFATECDCETPNARGFVMIGMPTHPLTESERRAETERRRWWAANHLRTVFALDGDLTTDEVIAVYAQILAQTIPSLYGERPPFICWPFDVTRADLFRPEPQMLADIVLEVRKQTQGA